MADEEQGLTLVLTPIQMAAVLKGGSIGEDHTFVNRLWGGGQLLFSGLQLAGGVGLLFTPEPTMVTKVGGVVLVAHGADSAQAAARQIWTGEVTKDLTQTTAEEAARLMGASPQTSYWVGVGVDVAVPLGASLALGAERILSIRAGRMMLAGEEAAGGHTIAKHVGQTETALRARLAAEPRIPAATSFTNIDIAAKSISEAMKGQASAIETWAKTATTGQSFVINYSTAYEVGSGVVRSTGRMEAMSALRIVVRKSQVAGKLYFVLTAFPKP